MLISKYFGKLRMMFEIIPISAEDQAKEKGR